MEKILKKAKFCSVFSFLVFISSQIIILISSFIFEKILSVTSSVMLISQLKMLIPLLLLILMKYLLNLYKEYKETTILHELRENVYQLYLKNIYRKSKYSNGDFLELISKDIGMVTKRYAESYPQMIGSFIFLAISLAILKISNNSIFIFTCCSALIYIIFPLLANKKFQLNYSGIVEIEAKLTNYFINNITAQSVFLFHGTEWIRKKLNALIQYYNVKGTESELLAQTNNAVNDFLKYFLKFGSIFYGLILVNNSELTFAQFIGLNVIMMNVISLVDNISRNAVINKVQKIALNRVMSIANKTEADNEFIKSNNFIKVKDLSLCYGEFQVLHKINLVIEKKDKIFLMGENGSGKSSLIKILVNEIEGYTGEVEVNECFFESLSGAVSYIPQKMPFIDFTGYELKEIYADKQGLNEEKFYGMYDKLEGRLLNLTKKLKDCSSGEIKKIVIALELAKDSHIIFMDEPTNYLDRASIDALKEILAAEDKAVILVAHDDHLLSCCSRYLEMVKGTLYEKNT